MRFQDKLEGSGGSEEHDAIPSDLSIEKNKKKEAAKILEYPKDVCFCKT